FDPHYPSLANTWTWPWSQSSSYPASCFPENKSNVPPKTSRFGLLDPPDRSVPFSNQKLTSWRRSECDCGHLRLKQGVVNSQRQGRRQPPAKMITTNRLGIIHPDPRPE